MLKNNENKEVFPFEFNLPNNAVQLSCAANILYDKNKALSFKTYFLNFTFELEVKLRFSRYLESNSNLFFNSISVFNKNKKVPMYTLDG
jgi:hypothetical protein